MKWNDRSCASHNAHKGIFPVFFFHFPHFLLVKLQMENGERLRWDIGIKITSNFFYIIEIYDFSWWWRNFPDTFCYFLFFFFLLFGSPVYSTPYKVKKSAILRSNKQWKVFNYSTEDVFLLFSVFLFLFFIKNFSHYFYIYLSLSLTHSTCENSRARK